MLILLFAAVLLAAGVRWQAYLKNQARVNAPYEEHGRGGFALSDLSQHRSERPVGFRTPSAPDFSTAGALVSRELVFAGGPPKDGIPALFPASREAVSTVGWLPSGERVIGVEISGERVAYPLGILVWHECQNDVVGGVPIAVTYCPLCDSVSVIDRRVGDEVVEFGISGLLYNSNVLLYDRQEETEDESLWSQVAMKSIMGNAAGTDLRTLPFSMMTWGEWKDTYPDSQVISPDTGYQRRYGSNPYGGYFAAPDELMFEPTSRDERLPLKARVIGLLAGEESLAVPLTSLPSGAHTFALGAGEVRVAWDAVTARLEILDKSEGVEVVHTFWFAWAAMHPGTEIWN